MLDKKNREKKSEGDILEEKKEKDMLEEEREIKGRVR